MAVTVHRYTVPKSGSSATENEDAAEYSVAENAQGTFCRAAICDGASEGFLSGPWARLLAQTLIESDSTFDATVADARSRFAHWELAYFRAREEQGRMLQWFEEEPLARGPFATALSINVQAPNVRRASFHATAVGDACLALVRGQDLQQVWPIENSQDFGLNPALIAGRSRPVPSPSLLDGRLSQGDRLILMTDAVSEWLVRTSKEEPRAWRALCSATLSRRGAADDWVAEKRSSGEMKNDDATWMEVQLRGVARTH